jgi:hypothetical protein
MLMRCKSLIAAAIVALWLLPTTEPAAAAPAKQAKSAKTKVHVTKRWRGYGFLPGYRPQLAESQGTPVYGRPLPRREARYFDYYGNVYYGWGAPGFYRGRWNGGSFGPCWASTPIGMMPTCGQ